MSEISEACQVIILCGKFAIVLKDITVALAVMSAQVMSTIYMAKWKGDTSYKRLLNIKGEENGLVFVNIGIEADTPENAKILKGIKKEMTDHGILFAELPDLCGGDGNTQLCLSAVDAQKLSAMLMSHTNGRYKHIAVAEISQFDYTATARRADGSPTPEFKNLKESAAENQQEKAQGKEAPEVPETEAKTSVRERITGSGKVKKETKTLHKADTGKIKENIKAARGSSREVISEETPVTEKRPLKERLSAGNRKVKVTGKKLSGPDKGQTKAVFQRQVKKGREAAAEKDAVPESTVIPAPVVKAPESGGRLSAWFDHFRELIAERFPGNLYRNAGGRIIDMTGRFTGETRLNSGRQPGYADGIADPCPVLPKKVVAQILREHELQTYFGASSCMWLDETPVLSKKIGGDTYHLVSLPDGEKGIIIPDSAYREKLYDHSSGYYLGKRGAFVSEMKEYYTVDYKTGDIGVLGGKDVLKEARKTPVESYAAKIEKLMKDAKAKALLGDKLTSAVSRKL